MQPKKQVPPGKGEGKTKKKAQQTQRIQSDLFHWSEAKLCGMEACTMRITYHSHSHGYDKKAPW